jgi:YMGG-like Gly-zipper
VTPAATPPPPPPPPPAPRSVTVPVGTSVRIQMIDSVDSSTDQVGRQFRASLQAPIVVDDEVIVPRGLDVFVKLTQARSSGKIQGQSELQIALDHLQFQGKSYALNSSTYEQKGESRGKDTVKKVGIGTAIGAAIGAIAGGGKGAAIGAGVGAGAGTAAQVFIKGKQVKIPSETKLDFTLEQPLEITLSPGARSRSQIRPPTEDSQQ